MGLLDTILAEKARFVPDSGWNLVGLDEFQPAGEKLYLIGHFTDKELANAELAKRLSAGGDQVFLYGADAA